MSAAAEKIPSPEYSTSQKDFQHTIEDSFDTFIGADEIKERDIRGAYSSEPLLTQGLPSEEMESEMCSILFSELDDVFQECASPNWGGEGEVEITEETLGVAKGVISLFPLSILTPSVGPTPDGGINFEWRNGERDIFLLTVTGIRELIYAGILEEGGRVRGKVPISSINIQYVNDILKQYFASSL